MQQALQILSGAWPEEPGVDTALSKLILDAVSEGAMPATLRLYVPGREVAFGKRDVIAAEYPAAVAAAGEAGFVSVQRLAGGRAAVFTEHTIAFSLAVPHEDPRTTIHERFREVSALMVEAFAQLGVAAEIGEVPGEYCPGEFSVNHERRIKLMGVGQRLAKRAAHVGGVIAVNRTDLLLRALIPVYRALDLEWRPMTTGSLGDVRNVTNEAVIEALKGQFRRTHAITKGKIDGELVDHAREIAAAYLPAVTN
jgi:lipoate-protein ligase A